MLFRRPLLTTLLLLPIGLGATTQPSFAQDQRLGCTHFNISDSGVDCLQRPYVLILPGILGEQAWDRNLRRGLLNSGGGGDVEIFDWTGGPLMIGFNIGGNQSKTDYLTQRIVAFKNQHPSRPLYLIGHSGGCRMALNILEALPEPALVEKSLLLSPCIEASYDLGAATRNCRSGLFAFRSPIDVPISLPLTAVHGLAHGRFSVSASVIGFRNPVARHSFGESNFYQIDYAPEMLSAGHPGGHFGWTAPGFVSQYLAPLLTSQSFPGGSESHPADSPSPRNAQTFAKLR